MLFQSIFLTYQFVTKKNPRFRINLLTWKEYFLLQTVVLVFLIQDSSSIFFDHLFDPKTRLEFVLFTSITFDTFILLIIPTVLLYRSVDGYVFLWTGRKFKIKKSKFLIITGPIEPRKDYHITNIKPRRRKIVRITAIQMETISELPRVDV
jgi:hypothetical protein